MHKHEVGGRSPETNLRLARHESAHGFIGVALFGPSAVSEITILPGLGYAGRCIGPEYKEPLCFAEADQEAEMSLARAVIVRTTLPKFGESVLSDAEIAVRAKATCIQLLAGTVAEEVFWPDEDAAPSEHDEIAAKAMALIAVSSVRAVPSFLAYCCLEARYLIEDHLDVIDAIAADLLEHGTLSGGQVNHSIRRVMARRAHDAEHACRAAWRRRLENAAKFDSSPPK